MREWFQWTHEPIATGWVPPVMRLVRLPADGAIGDQDAWLMQALTAMADEVNAIFLERWKDEHSSN